MLKMLLDHFKTLHFLKVTQGASRSIWFNAEHAGNISMTPLTRVRKNFWTNYFFPVILSVYTKLCKFCYRLLYWTHFLPFKNLQVPRVGVLTKGGSVQVFVRSILFPVLCKRDLRLLEVVDWSKPVSNYGKALNSTTYLKEPGELYCDTR